MKLEGPATRAGSERRRLGHQSRPPAGSEWRRLGSSASPTICPSLLSSIRRKLVMGAKEQSSAVALSLWAQSGRRRDSRIELGVGKEKGCAADWEAAGGRLDLVAAGRERD